MPAKTQPLTLKESSYDDVDILVRGDVNARAIFDITCGGQALKESSYDDVDILVYGDVNPRALFSSPCYGRENISYRVYLNITH